MPLRLPRALHGAQGELPARGLPRVIYYASEWRISTRTPVLLVHAPGLAGSSYEMFPLYTRFARTRPTYALDLPGYGGSERGPHAYDAATYVETVRAMIAFVADRHGAVDVVASSLACEFAAAVASQSDTRVRSLALLSPTGLAARPERARRGSRLAALLFGSKAAWRAVFLFLTTRFVLGLATRRLLHGRLDENLVDYAHLAARRHGAHYAAWAYVTGRLAVPDIAGVYARLGVPTLVVHDQDPRTSFARLPDLEKENPHVKSTRLTPTRGLPHWDASEETYESIVAHFAGARVPPERTSSPTLEVVSIDDTDDVLALADATSDDRISSPA